MSTVAIVDDNASVRRMLRELLEYDTGVDVIGEAANGVAGLALIERTNPRIAIIDLHMPGLDGVALIQAVRAHPSPTRLVAYSADPYRLVDALEAGADAVILKSASVNELLEAVLSFSGARPVKEEAVVGA